MVIPPDWVKTSTHMGFRLPNLSFKKRIKQSQNEERKKKVFLFEKTNKKERP